MRPTSFDASALRAHLLRHKIADLSALKRVLGTATSLTVFRKLKLLSSLTSYTHRGRFYSLSEVVRFNELGLWEHDSVWFSRHGTLLSTVEAFVKSSDNGYFARELTALLHTEVQQPLRHLIEAQRLGRTDLDGQFLYTSTDPSRRRQQTLARRSRSVLPGIVHAANIEVSPDELKAAILLYYATLDEQQRRLFAGLESMRTGYGGDKLIADFLNLDPHTVSRGRQQLLDQDLLTGRARREGGGRPRQEKKHLR
ncbi:MAG: hypothetical protein JNL62_05655 [Bryobacterales bacterium]|nr:hypothetical protein [Bryobacterales bacterium]